MVADLGDSGGPAGFIYGLLFVWAGTLATYASLGELASMLYPLKALDDLMLISSRAPTAGGQYHWVSMLALPHSQKILSYITGTLLANHPLTVLI